MYMVQTESWLFANNESGIGIRIGNIISFLP